MLEEDSSTTSKELKQNAQPVVEIDSEAAADDVSSGQSERIGICLSSETNDENAGAAGGTTKIFSSLSEEFSKFGYIGVFCNYDEESLYEVFLKNLPQLKSVWQNNEVLKKGIKYWWDGHRKLYPVKTSDACELDKLLDGLNKIQAEYLYRAHATLSLICVLGAQVERIKMYDEAGTNCVDEKYVASSAVEVKKLREHLRTYMSNYCDALSMGIRITETGIIGTAQKLYVTGVDNSNLRDALTKYVSSIFSCLVELKQPIREHLGEATDDLVFDVLLCVFSLLPKRDVGSSLSMATYGGHSTPESDIASSVLLPVDNEMSSITIADNIPRSEMQVSSVQHDCFDKKDSATSIGVFRSTTAVRRTRRSVRSARSLRSFRANGSSIPVNSKIYAESDLAGKTSVRSDSQAKICDFPQSVKELNHDSQTEDKMIGATAAIDELLGKMERVGTCLSSETNDENAGAEGGTPKIFSGSPSTSECLRTLLTTLAAADESIKALTQENQFLRDEIDSLQWQNSQLLNVQQMSRVSISIVANQYLFRADYSLLIIAILALDIGKIRTICCYDDVGDMAKRTEMLNNVATLIDNFTISLPWYCDLLQCIIDAVGQGIRLYDLCGSAQARTLCIKLTNRMWHALSLLRNMIAEVKHINGMNDLVFAQLGAIEDSIAPLAVLISESYESELTCERPWAEVRATTPVSGLSMILNMYNNVRDFELSNEQWCTELLCKVSRELGKSEERIQALKQDGQSLRKVRDGLKQKTSELRMAKKMASLSCVVGLVPQVYGEGFFLRHKADSFLFSVCSLACMMGQISKICCYIGNNASADAMDAYVITARIRLRELAKAFENILPWHRHLSDSIIKCVKNHDDDDKAAYEKFVGTICCAIYCYKIMALQAKYISKNIDASVAELLNDIANSMASPVKELPEFHRLPWLELERDYNRVDAKLELLVSAYSANDNKPQSEMTLSSDIQRGDDELDNKQESVISVNSASNNDDSPESLVAVSSDIQRGDDELDNKQESAISVNSASNNDDSPESLVAVSSTQWCYEGSGAIPKLGFSRSHSIRQSKRERAPYRTRRECHNCATGYKINPTWELDVSQSQESNPAHERHN